MAKKSTIRQCKFCGKESGNFINKTTCRQCYDYNRKAEREGFNQLAEQQFPRVLTIGEAQEEIALDRANGTPFKCPYLLLLDPSASD